MELNPQPEFASDTGLTLVNGARVTGGQLVLPSGSPVGPIQASWTSPETLTEGYYRYDLEVDQTDGVEDQCTVLYLGNAAALIYGAGTFQGVIYTKATSQSCMIRANDTEHTAKLSHCRISRE